MRKFRIWTEVQHPGFELESFEVEFGDGETQEEIDRALDDILAEEIGQHVSGGFEEVTDEDAGDGAERSGQ